MKVIMDITGIDNNVIVSIPDTYTVNEVDLTKGTTARVFHINKKQAEEMAIETVCMIKENDIDIIDVT